jgi:hypothetical protein
VLRLRALSGRGCLMIFQMFNRRHAGDGMSVGKTFVAETIKKQAHRAQAHDPGSGHRRHPRCHPPTHGAATGEK